MDEEMNTCNSKLCKKAAKYKRKAKKFKSKYIEASSQAEYFKRLLEREKADKKKIAEELEEVVKRTIDLKAMLLNQVEMTDQQREEVYQNLTAIQEVANGYIAKIENSVKPVRRVHNFEIRRY